MTPPSLRDRIAAALRQSLASGAHLPGDRFLSARELARREGVSLPTAAEALRLMELEGRLVARPRSGFFVRRPPAPEPAPAPLAPTPVPVDMSSLARALFVPDRADAVSLAAALPDPAWLPHAALRRALRGAQNRLGPREQGYSVPPGHAGLRRQIARRAATWGASFGPDDVVLVNGATQALALALRSVCAPGDVVAIERPCYFGLLLLLESLGLRAVCVAVDPRLGLDLDDLARLLRTTPVRAMVATPTVQNPLGAVMPPQRKRALVEMLEAAGVPLIEDDVYGDLAGDETRPPACKAYERDGGVIYCSSVSKTLAPGWRLGWIVAGRRHDVILRARLAQDWAGAPLPEAALADLLAGGDYDRHLARLKPRVARARGAIASRVEETFPAGVRLTRPQAGYLLWVELPAPLDAMEVWRRARAAGVGVSPGPMFCPERGLTSHLRLNCAREPTPALLAAVSRLGAICRDPARL